MRIRLSSIGACLVALSTFLAVPALPASAGSSFRGGDAAQSRSAEGGQSYRRDRDGDRRGNFRRKAPKGFEGGHSYRRDDHRWKRDRDYGYRHHKRHHDDRKRVHKRFRDDWDDRRYRRDDDRRGHGRRHRDDFGGNRSSAPSIVIEVNPWLAD